MTPEDIERMAREAGMHQDGDSWYCVGPGKYDDHDVSTEALTRFAALVRAQALADAARVSTWLSVEIDAFAGIEGNVYSAVEQYAAAIRALAGQPGA